MSDITFTIPSGYSNWLKQLGVATLYLLLGYVMQNNIANQGIVSPVWPGSGLALAALLIGGRHYLWGLFFGALLLNILTNNAIVWIVGATSASLLEALLGYWLLTCNDKFSSTMNTLTDYMRLIGLGGVIASLFGAIIGALALQNLQINAASGYFRSVLHWWMGDTLGVVLVTPFLLAWRQIQIKQELATDKRFFEELLVVGITFIAGQIVFLGWFNENLLFAPKAFVMFLFITWSAIRLGIFTTTFTLNLIAVQALLGACLKVGYFANELNKTAFYTYWFYMLILSATGMVLAVYVNELKQKELGLRASETHLRLSQINGGIGTWEADLLSNKQKWSDNCIALLGFPGLSQPTWDDFLAAIHPDDRQRVINVIEAHKKDQTKYEVEYRLAVNQENRWLRSAGQVERNADGKLTIMRGIVQDVTERKQVEQALIESEELLRESQAISGLGTYVLDISTGIWKSSIVLDKLFGIDDAYPHTVKGWVALIHPENRTMMYDYFKNEVLGQGKAFDKEYRIIPLDEQEERWVHGLGKLEFDAQGRPLKMHGTIQDITERKHSEKRLRQNEEKLRAYLDNISDTIWLIDSNLNMAYVSPNVTRLLGVSPAELVGRPSSLIIHPDDLNLLADAHLYVMEHLGEPHTVQYRVQHKDGRWIYVESTGVNMFCNPEINGVLVSMRNINERKQAELELRIAATAFESQEGMFVTDAQNMILRINRSFTRITGYSAEEVLGKNPRIFQSGRHGTEFYTLMWESIQRLNVWEGEIWNCRKNGEIFPEYLTITAVKDQDGIVRNYVATFNDITSSKAAANEIERLAFYDPLTGLPNRRLLWDRLRTAQASSNRSGCQGALLFIDMDNFKTLNDSHGHDMGDLLLKQVAQRLESCIREGDTVARLGGDEFVVMLEDLSEHGLEAAARTEAVGKKILANLNQPYQLARHECHSTPSIGATLFKGHDQSIDELLKQADIAMYQAKSSGRNTLRFFDPQMQASISARVELEADLRQALVENQFKLYYQPQVCHNRQVIGAEVLIRWLHPQRGLVSPADFIPLAEETGLILAIGQWVLETACARIKIWEGDEHTRHLQLAVNVSARQFRQVNFVELVSEILRREAINPDRLKLELTESLVLDDIEDTVRKMNALREIGVRFSMDDFGTGYSSLAYLTKLPLDQLKIDQSFVHNIGEKATDAVIVQTIIGMANNLGMEVIAEGVETEAQRMFLEKHDCQVFQGFLFSEPLTIEKFESIQKQS